MMAQGYTSSDVHRVWVSVVQIWRHEERKALRSVSGAWWRHKIMPNLLPKVFGLGLSRTGTVSLGDALNIVGIKTIHFPSDEQTHNELKSGIYDLSILDVYQGIVDIPVAPFYAQLDTHYPGSKFVLTVREKESWLRSCESFLPIVRDLSKANQQFTDFVHFIHACVYGVVPFNRERFSYVYDIHLRNVQAYFSGRPNDLLVIDITAGEGWEKLCPFLGVDIPDLRFPHANVSSGLVGVSDWANTIERAREEILAATPVGATVILADDGMLGLELDAGRHVIPLDEPEEPGVGERLDDRAVARTMERLGHGPASFMVFAKWILGWPDEYAELHHRLRERFECVLDNDRLVVFDLRAAR
jgi:hypothetical protein